MTDDPTAALDRFFASYRAAYTDLDLEAVGEHYAAPLLSVTPDGPIWMEDEQAVQKVMGAYLETLEAGGYDRGEIDDLVYHPLTADAVIASSAWTRYSADGEIYERLGTTYLLHRTDEEGWRIVALILHEPEAIVE